MYSRITTSLFVGFLCIGGVIVYATGSSLYLRGSYGLSLSPGVYSTGGNAGVVSFTGVPSGYSPSEVVGFGASSLVYITGTFWMETTGWATFSDVGAGGVILIPPGTGASLREPWYLSGYAWSPNAGWIKFNHGQSYASGVAFLPDSTSLIGYAWSDTLGWIPFGSGAGIAVDQAFIGKINVGGNIGGTKSFSTLYTPGNVINIASLSTFLGSVRKNVMIISRNAEKNNKINTNFTLSSPTAFNNILVYNRNSNPSNEFLRFSTIETAFNNPADKTRSLIVIGGDIYINTGIISPSYVNYPRAIIALKNESGQGGNIYIKGSIKNIQASLIADGTIWSGEEFLTGTLSPYVVSKKSVFLDLPKTQLYIQGLVASYNTIGGAAKDGGASCPVFTRNNEPCTYDTAIPYDWNYFRAYDESVPTNRAYPNSSKDEFSVVMEPDPRVFRDPPPGLENVRQ